MSVLKKFASFIQKEELILLLALLVIATFIVLFSGVFKEKFTTHYRDGVLCEPVGDTFDQNILPNSIVFAIQGYNYQNTPIIYRNGKKLVPLQFSQDYSNAIYYLTVWCYGGIKNINDYDWVLETSDFVKPIVSEARTGTNLNVENTRRRRSHNLWKLTA